MQRVARCIEIVVFARVMIKPKCLSYEWRPNRPGCLCTLLIAVGDKVIRHNLPDAGGGYGRLGVEGWWKVTCLSTVLHSFIRSDCILSLKVLFCFTSIKFHRWKQCFTGMTSDYCYCSTHGHIVGSVHLWIYIFFRAKFMSIHWQ